MDGWMCLPAVDAAECGDDAGKRAAGAHGGDVEDVAEHTCRKGDEGCDYSAGEVDGEELAAADVVVHFDHIGRRLESKRRRPSVAGILTLGSHQPQQRRVFRHVFDSLMAENIP